jgi:membrane-associated HD superfamily phosphohydrolase
MATNAYLWPVSNVSWPSIFAGTFVFLAIEVTFGVLGTAIFASAINPASANPVGAGISFGLGIWMLVLSIIALHFAGRVSSSLSGLDDRGTGMWQGLITFGMCIFTSLLIASMSVVSASSATPNASPSEGYVVHAITTGGWWLFFTLLFGMIAAGIGGAHAIRKGPVSTSNIQDTAPRVRNIA